MSIRGFVLGVILLALVGWCMVEESVTQLRLRYQLAELTRREKSLHENLAALRAEEEQLRSPLRLNRLLREKNMEMVSLGTTSPSGAVASGDRRPGEVLDQAFVRSMDPVRMADAGQW